MDQPLTNIDGTTGARRHFRYFDFVMVGFVVILLLSNLIGAAKQAQLALPLVGTITFGAGVLFFPVSYIIGDVMTEVYGYARARRVIESRNITTSCPHSTMRLAFSSTISATLT